jgi:hypothetical protein
VAKKIKYVKKAEDGKLHVSFDGDDATFYEIKDDEIAAYVIYLLATGEKQSFQNVNSRLK